MNEAWLAMQREQEQTSTTMTFRSAHLRDAVWEQVQSRAEDVKDMTPVERRRLLDIDVTEASRLDSDFAVVVGKSLLAHESVAFSGH
eukprot:3597724-Amphidinium_carterae.1